MPYINLLPWRETARKERQQQFLAILGVISGLVVFLVFLLNMYYSERLAGQEYRNNYLRSEISILDQRIREIRNLNKTKDDLNQRIELIELLQESRNLGTQIFNEIARVVPAGIYLTKVEKKGSGLLINGKSESNNRLSNMMREIERSELLEGADLDSIVSAEREDQLLSDFSMTIAVKGYIPEQKQGGKSK
ncbi:PilN domain-containing protein [Psychrosphaera ytuae]|uniref:PilN domain-containing protein n=1 Tax=Psychrosphaera ytuae TaxID=2820710 RepID=A0A975HJH0_9GAMM|nr:PilN domain-containing protein [Psychrosphaera ytuae]QTH65218.1 PilN domain-containing protein [Psychrosphaera ytuae]